MKNAPIRFLVLLGALTMAAIVFIQIYWVSQAVDRQEEQFKHSVQMALRNVVESLCEINGNDIPSNPIDQLSNNYFIARTNYRIDLSSLDYLLKAELEKRNIDQDYEFGVYDCQTDRMVYGDFVSLKEKTKRNIPVGKLPKLSNEEYYFGVYFPEKSAGVVNSMGVWKLTSGLTLIILVFFSYGLFVILKQKRLSEIQKDFINNMTHEFKTPLATLQVSSEVLLNEATNDRQRKYAGIALAETDRLQKHVQQLLETSLQDHHTTHNHFVKFEVVSVLKRIMQRFRDHPGKVIKEHYEISSISIKGDPLIFETMVFNLIDNAIKYGRQNIEIRLSETRLNLRLDVLNDGDQIQKKEQKKIFTKFYRVNKGNVHDVKGFGLGLYFVKKAVAGLKGKIFLTSDENGTCFTLTIPKSL